MTCSNGFNCSGCSRAAPIPGAEDNAWFALLDLNERANALALYYLYKGNTLKRKASAFRKWFRNCSVHSSGNVAPTAQKGFGDSEHLSTFEKRRLELLEMAAAVTAATSSLGSKSFDHMLRSRSEEAEGSQVGYRCYRMCVFRPSNVILLHCSHSGEKSAEASVRRGEGSAAD